jgi:hypothetical protein
MKLQQLFFFLCMGTLVMSHNLIGMAAVEKVFQKISIFQQRPYLEEASKTTLSSYAYSSKNIDFLRKQIHMKVEPDADPLLFVESSYQAVSEFLQELSQNSKAHILEFDCSKSDTLDISEQNKEVQQLFEQASRLYDETHEPVIIHFHHLEGGLIQGEHNLGLHHEYDKFMNGDKNIILISSTETSGEQLRDDFLDRHCGLFTIENKTACGLGTQARLDAYNQQVKRYNYGVQAMGALVVAGGIVGSVVLLLVLKKKLQSNRIGWNDE